MRDPFNYTAAFLNRSLEVVGAAGTAAASAAGDAPTGGGPRWAMLCLMVIPLWILIGNMLVLLAVCFHRGLRTLSNWVIASLALTDFLLALLVVPLGTYQVVSGKWELGLTVCLMWTGMDVFLSTTSILHLGAIAIHRYYGIKYPLRMRSTQDKRHVVILLLPAWTVSIAISLPLIIQGAMDSKHVLIGSEERGYSCGIFDRTFAIYSSLVSFFIPLAIMMFADIRSIQILRRNIHFPVLGKPKADHCQSNGGGGGNGNDDGGGRVGMVSGRRSRTPESKESSFYELTPGETTTTATMLSPLSPMIEEYRSCPEATSEQDLVYAPSPPASPSNTPPRRARTRAPSYVYKGRARSKSMVYISMLASRGAVKLNSRERRAERALIWVVVSFVVLWLPFFITNLTYGVCATCDIPSDIFMAFTWLGYMSSGVNPCIYTLLNRDFRHAFVRILTCRRVNLARKPTT